jgi:hypothetical protein
MNFLRIEFCSNTARTPLSRKRETVVVDGDPTSE